MTAPIRCGEDCTPEDVPPEYWLQVCDGMDAARAWLESDGPNVAPVLNSHPILALPEFPAALEVIGALQSDPEVADVCRTHADWLRALQTRVPSEHPRVAAAWLLKCGVALGKEQAGMARVNASAAIVCLKRAGAIFRDGPEFGRCLLNEGNARQTLAGLGVNVLENLEMSIERYVEAAAIFGEGPSFAGCMLNEGIARRALAGLGVDAKENLGTAIQRYREARSMFDHRPDVALCLLHEGNAHRSLAELGVDARENLLRAMLRYEQAAIIFGQGTSFAECLMGEGVARSILAGLGVHAEENLERAVRLCSQAAAIFREGPSFASSLANEGTALRILAGLGRKARENLEQAIRRYEEAAAIFREGPGFAGCLLNEGTARASLAELGVDARENLEGAIRLYEEATAVFAEGPSFAECLMGEANARAILAGLDVQAQENLQRAIRGYREAAAIFQEGPSFGLCLMNEGNVRWRLARLGVDARQNLERAIEQYEEAAAIFRTGPDLARCLMNEGAVRSMLAGLGVDAQENLGEAIRHFGKAAAIFGDGPSFARCLANEAGARTSLAELGMGVQENLEEAIRRYREAGVSLERLGFHADAQTAFGTLGQAALRHERWEAAREGFEPAITNLEQIRGRIALTRDRQAWMEQNIGLFKGMVEACLRLGRFDEALEYAERGRSRALVDLLYMEELVPRSIAAEQTEEYRRLRRQAAVLDAELTVGGIGTEPLRGDGDRAPGAERESVRPASLARSEERARVTARLRELEDVFRGADPEFFPLAKPLAVDGLVALARRLERTLVIPWIGARQSVVFLVWPDGEAASAVDHLPLEGVTEAAVREWMLGPSDDPALTGWLGTYLRYQRGEVTLRDWMEQMEQTLALLHERVMGPVRERLRERDARRGALIVGGSLGLLPLHAACRKDASGDRYLSDELDIVYSPSAWILDRCSREERREAWTPVLAVGNPTTDNASPLPGAEWETEAIARLVRRRMGAESVDRRIREQATAHEVERLLPTHPVAHLSCHGAWNQQDALQSALYLAGSDRLTLSHLLSSVDMAGSRLVVLSACETASGYRPGSSGEEYLGLPAGFIVAGARTVVGSLWSVPDVPTTLLMTRFYQEMLEGREVAEALRAAQLWLKGMTAEEALTAILAVTDANRSAARTDLVADYEDWLGELGAYPFRHPYYWAAFQVLGNPGGSFHN